MEYLVTGRQAKAIDTYTIEHTGIPSLVLMERASLTIAEETAQVAAQLKLPAVRIAAVCGSGNNGGDDRLALSAARGCVAHDTALGVDKAAVRGVRLLRNMRILNA